MKNWLKPETYPTLGILTKLSLSKPVKHTVAMLMTTIFRHDLAPSLERKKERKKKMHLDATRVHNCCIVATSDDRRKSKLINMQMQ
jgi:hypothetical protein